MCGKYLLQSICNKTLLQFFAEPIGDVVCLSHETNAWDLLPVSHHFNYIMQLITIKSAAGCDDDRICFPFLDLMCKQRLTRLINEFKEV